MDLEPKLRVLFVEHDPVMLELLPHALADMRPRWDMEFVASAEEGLEMLSRTAFDVVLSDLHMPGMNGIEFLTKVREHFPSSARILFSACSDKQTILESVGIPHQFLPKPCPIDVLKAVVRRTTTIRSLLPDEAIREKVSKIEHLPRIPTLYLELVRQLQTATTSIETIAATVSQDMEMTSQVLKIVNSAFFGLPQPTSNVAEAISFLGVEVIKHFVLAAGVFSQYGSRRLGGICLEDLWRHSIRTGEVARLIAKDRSTDRHLIDDAAAAGLLHDVGKLVLASNYPEAYDEVAMRTRKESVEWLVAEREVLGCDHAEVGGYLLGLWGLPSSIVEAVACHHLPGKSAQMAFTALTAVHVANVLAQTRRRSYRGIVSPQVDLLYLAKTGQINSFDHWLEEMNEPAI